MCISLLTRGIPCSLYYDLRIAQRAHSISAFAATVRSALNKIIYIICLCDFALGLGERSELMSRIKNLCDIMRSQAAVGPFPGR